MRRIPHMHTRASNPAHRTSKNNTNNKCSYITQCSWQSKHNPVPPHTILYPHTQSCTPTHTILYPHTHCTPPHTILLYRTAGIFRGYTLLRNSSLYAACNACDNKFVGINVCGTCLINENHKHFMPSKYTRYIYGSLTAIRADSKKIHNSS